MQRSYQALRQLYIKQISHSTKKNHLLIFRNYAEQPKFRTAVNDDIKLTDSCTKRLKQVADKDEFLRVSVDGGGCSGFSYKFDLDKAKQDGDMVFSRDGVSVVTDPESFELIKGSTVDYAEELIKSSFFIASNPQANSGCSCGVSFSIDL